MQSADSIRDANVRYHDLAAEHYDSKWGINYGEVGQAQVTGKLRKALGHEPRRYARALEIGAGTGYFSLNLLRAGVVGEAVATDISPGMLRRARATRRPSSGCRRRDGRVRGRPSCRSTTTRSTSSSATRCCTTCPTSTPRSASSGACCGRAASWRSAASPRYYGDRIASWPKRGANAVAPLWRALMGAAPRPSNGNGNGGWSEEDRLEQVVDVHAFTPAELAGHARGRRLRRRPRERRGARGEPVRMGEPDAGGVGRPARRALGLARVRLPRLPAAPDAGPLAAGAAPAGGALLQPAHLGARCRPARGARRGSGTPARTASSCAAKARPRKSAIEVRNVQSSTPIVPAIGP